MGHSPQNFVIDSFVIVCTQEKESYIAFGGDLKMLELSQTSNLNVAGWDQLFAVAIEKRSIALSRSNLFLSAIWPFLAKSYSVVFFKYLKIQTEAGGPNISSVALKKLFSTKTMEGHRIVVEHTRMSLKFTILLRDIFSKQHT